MAKNIEARKRFIKLSKIMEYITGCDIESTFNSQRRQPVTLRSFIYYKMRKDGFGASEISLASGKDHATIIHALANAKEMIESNHSGYKLEADLYREFESMVDSSNDMILPIFEGFDFNRISEMVHEANIKKGFDDGLVDKGTYLMMVVGELAEALEADRKDRFANKERFIHDMNAPISEHEAATPSEILQYYFKEHVKDTFEDEIADAIIRLFHIAGMYGIDLNFHVNSKLLYNSTREYRHGKKY